MDREKTARRRASDVPTTEREGAIFGTLVARGVLSEDQFKGAVEAARQRGGDLETVLCDDLKVPKRALGDALSFFYKCPFVEPDPKFAVSPRLLAKLNPHYLAANLWAPMWRDGTTVHVLMHDPHAASRVLDIQQLFPGHTFRFYVALRRDIARFIERLSGAAPAEPATIEDILKREGSSIETAAAEDQAEAALDESDSVVVKLASQIIADAEKAGASDVHVEPYPDKEMVVRFRVDGDCVIHQKLPARYRRALVSRFKIMAGLDIAERRRPQDGKIAARGAKGKLELRVATLPTAGGLEDVVLRLAGSSEPVPLEKIGLAPGNLEKIHALLQNPHGLFLCVGPTGSGKTTTLHSCLYYLNGPDVKIWTAEDPVEITQYGLRQVQVHPKIGLTFASALRSFLRADPDVIMVGEMRDQETAETAIEASMTGHLVLSTLHTNSAVETVTRLLDMGVDPFNYADALLGVLSQRLVRRLCRACRGRESSTPSCEACGGSGYRGRVGIHELLVATPELKALIQKRAPASELSACARRQGMITLLEDGEAKCKAGETDMAQVRSAARS
jgi:type II secretory ATPase GspE/PulE/Tfp pilus assembly ATPase PilB-like protein